MPPKNEFREIGHSGGKFTVTVRTDNEGRRSFSLGVSSSAPVPQSIISVQVNFNGEVLGVSSLAWRPDLAAEGPTETDNFPVLVASDREGLFGHQCRRCGTYWRSNGPPANWAMTCPQCGLKVPSHQFLTDGQLAFIGAVLQQLQEALGNESDGEYTIDMDAIADQVQNGKEAPSFYYAEISQQCRFPCDTCRSSNDILGKYGYCSCCGYRNNLQHLRKDFKKTMAYPVFQTVYKPPS